MKFYIFRGGVLRELKRRRFSARRLALGLLRAAVACAIVFAVFFLASCGEQRTETLPPSQSPRLIIETPHTLFCAAYQLRVDVPQGWHIAKRNSDNLTIEPSYQPLVRHEYENGYTYDLCELWSKESSADKAHASIALYIEVFEDITLEDYIDALTSTLNSRRDGYISALSSSETTNDGTRDWQVLVAAVTPPGPDGAADSERYIEEYRICALTDDSYLVACITWWENSTASLEAATVARTVYTIG